MSASSAAAQASPTDIKQPTPPTPALDRKLLAKYDLTQTIIKHLDRHMVLPLLEHHQEQKLYNPQNILAEKVALISGTKMVDFAAEEYRKLHGKDAKLPDGWLTQEDVYEQLDSSLAACGPLHDILLNDEKSTQIDRHNLTLEILKEKHGVTDAHVEAVYRYAKLIFECGRYLDAANLLYYFRILSTDEEMNFWALWGKLAAECLMVSWDRAMDDMGVLREMVDSRVKVGHLAQLQQRTWILHWSLFIFFNHNSGRQDLIRFFSQDKLLNTIQTNCPHLFRYLVAAVIISKRPRTMVKETVRLISSDREAYTDPITDFLVQLFDEFDFDKAHASLQQAQQVVRNDFFLAAFEEQFMANSRVLLFRAYCRAHRCIDIAVLGERLDIKTDTERRIVELVREAGIDAKIDSNKNQLVLEREEPSVYQQVIDKTSRLMDRCENLKNTITHKYDQRAE